MSTRSQIRFVDEWEDEDGETHTNRAQVYRHWDGYPEVVLQTLKNLYETLGGKGALRDPSYNAANYIFIEKAKYLEREDYPNNLEDQKTKTAVFLGFGIEDPSTGIYGDEEFIYEVRVTERSINEAPDVQVKISDHRGFPTWDGDTEAAFEEARWQYEGSLDEAIEKFCD